MIASNHGDERDERKDVNQNEKKTRNIGALPKKQFAAERAAYVHDVP